MGKSISEIAAPENEKVPNTFGLPLDLLGELQNHSALPTLTKDGCVEYARSHGINVFYNLVKDAVSSGDLPSYLISSQALISPRDLIGWLLSKRRPNGPTKRRSA